MREERRKEGLKRRETKCARSFGDSKICLTHQSSQYTFVVLLAHGFLEAFSTALVLERIVVS